MKTMSKRVVTGLLPALWMLASVAMGEEGEAWQSLCRQAEQRGCRREQVEPILRNCSQRHFSTEQADRILNPVYTAMDEGLPVNCLYERIDEGLAKQVDVARIEAALNKRLDSLRTARSLLEELGDGRGGSGPTSGPPMLLENMALALESGLPAETIRSVFLGQKRLRYGRMAHVIEAGESLHLAGFQADQVQEVMDDFVTRNLNRHEMMRVVGLLREGLAQGRSFDVLYASIWIEGEKSASE